jgi:hypothetical protein
MDPFGVMNPGKSASDAVPEELATSAGATLPTTGWTYEAARNAS